ncbi:DivIVA domain-containing protein [Bifidobacterium aquikefiricola]|uniref:DivIVA domain-containing protein n=1 Tax=Bifidobacterium aquikefiricola TaxID=3059038 RepID=A0AB39U4V7_9BIFI
MARKPEANGNGTNIARVGKHKWGYDSQQVDEFLDNAHKLYESPEPKLTQRDIQDVSFGLRKNGYAVGQVDAALARLERAVVDKQTQWEIAQSGRVAWRGQTEAMYRKFISHCERKENERFKPGTSSNPSYDRKQVDRLLDQLSQKLSQELGESSTHAQESGELVDLTPTRVSNVVFTQRKGKKGYDERQVDYFLNYGVQLLSRIESYARVTDYSKVDAPQAVPPQTLSPQTVPSYEPQASDFGSLAALAEQENPNAQETQVFQPISQPTTQDATDVSHSDGLSQREVGQSTETIRPLFDENGSSIQTPPSRIRDSHRLGEDSAEARDDAAAYANESYSDNRPSSDASASQNDGRAMFKNLHREEQAIFNQSQGESQTEAKATAQMPEKPQQSYSSHTSSVTQSPADSDLVPQQANAGKVNYPEDGQTHSNLGSSNDAAAETSRSSQESAPQQAPQSSTFDFWGRGKSKSANTNSGEAESSAFANQDDSKREREHPVSETSSDTSSNDWTNHRTEGNQSAGEEASKSSPLSFPVADSQPDSKDTDQYLASLNSILDSTSFPKVDLDIPDLDFPTTDSVDGGNAAGTNSSTGNHADRNGSGQSPHNTSRNMFNNGDNGSQAQKQ